MTIRMIKPNKDLLPYPVIAAATLGDALAIHAVLRHYRGYITTLALCAVYDENGNIHFAIDTDVQDCMETALITGILNFDAAA